MGKTTDDGFRRYCASRAEEAECELSSEEIARLYRLIGPEWEDTAVAWEERAEAGGGCKSSLIRELVELSRDRLAA